MRSETQKALETLKLKKKYNAALYQKEVKVEGMLKKTKDWITWGEIDPEILGNLVRERGQLKGEGKVDQLFQRLNCKDLEELAKMICQGEILLEDAEKVGFNPTFRLHPPKGGFKYSTKRSFDDMGELGYRGDAINSLISRMI